MLHAISFGCNTPEVPDAVVQLMEAIPGVLPCTYCRASMSGFFKQALAFQGKTSLKELPCHQFPRFMYDLHNMVNYKLDWQHFYTMAPQLHAALGVPPEKVKRVLLAHNPIAHPLPPDASPPFYAGKHPSWECVQQRNSVFTFKVTAPDVMAVLFMIAMVYPCVSEDKDWKKPTDQHEDANTPARRRELFVQFITALPAVLRASSCGDEKLAGIIENVWRFCTEPGARMLGADPVITAIMQELATSMKSKRDLQAVCVFEMIWVIRAMYKDGSCSATPALAKQDQLDHHAQFSAAEKRARSAK